MVLIIGADLWHHKIDWHAAMNQVKTLKALVMVCEPRYLCLIAGAGLFIKEDRFCLTLKGNARGIANYKLQWSRKGQKF